MNSAEYHTRNAVYGVFFFAFYGVIVLAWITAIGYVAALRLGTNGAHDGDTSFVLSNYLINGTFLGKGQIAATLALYITDGFIKTNLVILGTVIGTIFLLYNIFPKMKNLNAWWMSLAFLAAYTPFIITVFGFFRVLTGEQSGLGWNFISFNEFLVLILLYPLNYAVFFYGYYILENYLLTPLRERATAK